MYYEAGNLGEIIPGYGYYICMGENSSTLYNNGDNYYVVGQQEVTMPPQVTLTTGWNLIGHYGENDVSKDDETGDLSGGILTDLADVTLLNEDSEPVDVLNLGQGYWAFITGQNNMLYAPSEADYDPDYEMS